jgi:hypothetical protein
MEAVSIGGAQIGRQILKNGRKLFPFKKPFPGIVERQLADVRPRRDPARPDAQIKRSRQASQFGIDCRISPLFAVGDL